MNSKNFPDEDEFKSVDIGRFALKMALTKDRDEEKKYKAYLETVNVKAVAVDFGGQCVLTIPKILECAVVAAQRQGVVINNHVGEGAVAGATHEVLGQIQSKAIGLNIGGKIGIARYKEHLCVAIYSGLGLLNFNEIAVGLAHRCVSE